MTSEGYDATKYIVTTAYRHFAEFCDSCRTDQDIGICYGRAGIGKTWAGLYYSKWLYLEDASQYNVSSPKLSPDIATCRTIFYTPKVVNSPQSVEKDIALLRRRLNSLVREAAVTADRFDYSSSWIATDYLELLIVDEANRLKQYSLEQLRDMYDRDLHGFGLVLMGMPGLEHLAKRYPQLYSRVGFQYPFEEMSLEEARHIIQAKWSLLRNQADLEEITDEEAIAAIIRFTRKDFREITKLLKQARRILENSGLKQVTKEVIDLAAKGLLRGQE